MLHIQMNDKERPGLPKWERNTIAALVLTYAIYTLCMLGYMMFYPSIGNLIAVFVLTLGCWPLIVIMHKYTRSK